MSKIIVASVLFVVSCGGAASPSEKLQGKWSASIAGGCLAAATFEGTTMELDTICTDADGSTIDVDGTIGSFTADESIITFTAAQSSCPAADATTSGAWQYSFSGDLLQIGNSNGLLSLTRIPQNGGGSGALIAFGCFKNGVFTPMPVRPL